MPLRVLASLSSWSSTLICSFFLRSLTTRMFTSGMCSSSAATSSPKRALARRSGSLPSARNWSSRSTLPSMMRSAPFKTLVRAISSTRPSIRAEVSIYILRLVLRRFLFLKKVRKVVSVKIAASKVIIKKFILDYCSIN